ncbi:hypothetical protein GCK32_000015 [Trichostrongylus colubriformis]|uniref:Uncharacterized protein n=1 Tax=Trichostrongylus colubriformis TaxID=6319 RepID=A0AAN8FN45_TRICO
MTSAIRIIALICCFIALTDSYTCKITVRVTSKTAKKFKALVIIPALGVQSLPMVFEGKGTKKVKVDGEDCGKKPWMVRTFKWKQNAWAPAKNITAKYQGNGWIRMVVGDDLVPRPMDRFGVACFEGTCG